MPPRNRGDGSGAGELEHDRAPPTSTKKMVHRPRREEGLQVRIHQHGKRQAGLLGPQIEADAPKVVWALTPVRPTTDGKAVKDRVDADEHTEAVGANDGNGRSLATGLAAELNGGGVRVVGYPPRRCVWTMVRSSYRLHCNGFAVTGSGSRTFRRVLRGLTATSNHSTTGCEGNASSALPCHPQ